jgi:zeaxanthin glucosyltransferase
MARICFLTDIEEGHVLPSFGLAHSLKRHGHDISFIGAPDSQKLVTDQGFGFHVVFSKIYPPGFNEKRKALHKAGFPNITRQRLHMAEIASDAFGAFLNSLKADLFILSAFLDVEALILYYRFGIEPVIYTPLLREPGMTITSNCLDEMFKMPAAKVTELVSMLDGSGLKARSFKDILQPLNTFCELVLCPGAFEIEERYGPNNFHYIGPAVSGRKGEGIPAVLPQGSWGKKIIYASMGSQTIAYGKICHHFFSTLLRVMKNNVLKDMHLVMAIGLANDERDFIPLSENVTVLRWVSQIDILNVASLAIVHGGLGTVKECIYYGVPMIVLPITRDQPSNAKRVEYHQLGTQLDPRMITDESIRSAILHVVGNEKIREGITKMQRIFRQKDEAEEGVTIIERLVNKAKTTLV